MVKNFEQMLAFYCAPTLAGIKPANLISWNEEDDESAAALLEKYNHLLNPRGIFLEQLSRNGSRILVLVYRRDLLYTGLQESQVAQFLFQAGYQSGWPLEKMLDYLKARIQTVREFPHEIGLFLGYPIDDVIGFIENKGENCKLCGYWKVYADEERTRQLFCKYTRCRIAFAKRLENALSIAQLIQPACC